MNKKYNLILGVLFLCIVICTSFISASPTINLARVNDTDSFYSNASGNRIVNVWVNISGIDLGAIPPSRAYANFTNIGLIDCNSGMGPLANLTNDSYGGQIYNATCSVGDESLLLDFSTGSGPILITAINPLDLPPAVATVNITLYNMTTPPQLGPETCTQFGPAITNMANVLDFARVNFVVNIQANFTCLSRGRVSAPTFRDVMILNLTSIDLSTPQKAQKLALLQSAMNVTLIAPHQHGKARIDINSSAFAELDSNATISFFYLPFTRLPAILADNPAKLNSTATTWGSNGYDSELQIATVNLTIRVAGFSGYNFTDQDVPIINIVPMVNLTNETVLINFTVNGTGTEPSYINFSLSGIGAVWIYNETYNSANCTSISADNETFRCLFRYTFNSGSQGTTTLYVSARDYGNAEPGNLASNMSSITLDWTGPEEVRFNSPVNGGYATSSVLFNVTAIDSYLAGMGSCWMTLNNGVKNYTMTQSTSPNIYFNYTNSSIADGNYLAKVYCNDSWGNRGTINTTNFTVDGVAPYVGFGSGMATPGALVTTNASISVNASYADSGSPMNLTIRIYDSSWNMQDSTFWGNLPTFNGQPGSGSSGWTGTYGGLGAQFPDGLYYINLTNIDYAGNVNRTSMNLTIDGNPPTVSITSPSAGYINNSRAIRINATVIDASLNYTLIEIRNITGAVLNSTANSSSNFSIVLTSPVDAVNLTINLTAYDLAGNKKSATVIVSVDTTNPSLVINSASGRMLTSTTVLYNFTTIDTNLNYCGWYRDDVLFTLSSPGEIQSGVDFANPYVGHSQGYHNWSVRCVDLAGNSNTSTVQNFTVDSVVPTVTSMSPADGAYKNTRNVTVFFTPTDTNLQNCTVFANGTIYGAYNSTNGLATGSAFNVTLLNRGVGYQNWSVICYDIMSSANSGITYSFTVDITAPAVPNTTISASSTSATLYYTSNESVNATVVSGTTVLGSTSSYANSSSVSLSGLSASTTYYYNITVCDQAGNCATNTSSSNFTTSAASSDDDGSTSGGSGSTYTTSSQIADGITKVFYPGEALTFTAAGATHSFLLVSIAYDLTTATIQLASAPQKATLTVGEEKKFDLDANGYYDVYVKLNNITTKMKADFTVRTINESMTAAPIVPAKNETDAAPSTVKEKVEEKVEQVTEAAKGGKGAWIFWTITVVVILLLGWWVVVSMRKGKKR